MLLLGDGGGGVGGGGASASSLGLVDELIHVPDGFMCRMVKLLIENIWRIWMVMS